MRLLLAIKSPLQALNAVELYYSLNPPPSYTRALVFYSPQRPTLGETIRKILLHIPNIAIYNLPPVPSERRWWHSPKELIAARKFKSKLKSTIIPSDNLAIGDYRSRECRAVTAFFNNRRITLLDDGSATHQIARYRHNPRDPRLAPMFPRADLRALRLFLWAGIQIPFIEHVTYFTHYKIKASGTDEVIYHKYPYWRSILNEKRQTSDSTVIFLGMSHVEKGLATLDRYLSALRKIKAFYPSREILYRPHRDETQEKLSAVRTLGFTVLEPDVTPVELKLIQADELPGEVACIASSAMDNLAVIFEGRIALRCFVPADDYCAAGMRGHFTDIIKHHTEGDLPNMQIVRLADLPCSS